MKEQVMAIAKEAGFKVRFKLLPYPRLMAEMASGKTDFSIFVPNARLAPMVRKVCAVTKIKLVLISKKDNPIASYEDLYNKEKFRNVGVFRGQKFFPKLLDDQKIRKEVIQNATAGIQMLALGRVDATLGIENTLFYANRQKNLNANIGFPGFLVKTMRGFLQLSKKSPNAATFPVEAVQKAVQNLLNTDAFRKINSKYYGRDTWEIIGRERFEM